MLEGGADQQHVGRQVVAEQLLGERLGGEQDVSVARLRRGCAPQAAGRRAAAPDGSVTIDAVGVISVLRTATVRAGSSTVDRLRRDGAEQIEAEQHVDARGWLARI